MRIEERKALRFRPALASGIVQFRIRKPDSRNKHGADRMTVARGIDIEAGYVAVADCGYKQQGPAEDDVQMSCGGGLR